MTDPSIRSILLALSGAEVVLGHGEHIVGRGTDCDVCFEDPLASRRHAMIAVGPDRVTIRDLGSRNGVLVNGDEIDSVRELAEGDHITLGSQVLVVREIGRGADGPKPIVSRRVSKPPIAKIAVTTRAVPEDEALAAAMRVAMTLSHSTLPRGRALHALRFIGEAAGRAIAAGRIARAEAILDPPLVEVLATLRAGIALDRELVDLAAQQAIVLARATFKRAWIDYVNDLYAKVQRSPPPAIAQALEDAAEHAR